MREHCSCLGGLFRLWWYFGGTLVITEKGARIHLSLMALKTFCHSKLYKFSIKRYCSNCHISMLIVSLLRAGVMTTRQLGNFSTATRRSYLLFDAISSSIPTKKSLKIEEEKREINPPKPRDQNSATVNGQFDDINHDPNFYSVPTFLDAAF